MQNYLSYGVKIWTDLSSVLSQCTRLIDRQTDRQAEFSSLDRVKICIPCSAVKSGNMIHNSIPLRAERTCLFSILFSPI